MEPKIFALTKICEGGVNVSIDVAVGPPWMYSTSGYFLPLTYSGGYVTVKLGPFLDVGKITDSSSVAASNLGSQKWLFDTGAQAKLKVLGVGVILLYGKDLRTGNNAFYATVGR